MAQVLSNALNNVMNPQPLQMGTANSTSTGAAPLTFSGGVQTPTSSTTSGLVAPKSTYTGGSIVDYLNSTGGASDYGSRSALAAKNGIQGYVGSADQNTQLLNMLRGGSAPASGASLGGGLIVPPANTGAPTGATGAGLVPPPAGPTPNPVPTTFPGMVGTVAAQGANPSPITQQANQQAQDAATAYQQYVKDMGTSQTNEANAIAGINQQPIPLEFQQGRGQVLQNQYTQQQAAIGQEEAGAASLYGPAIGAATTGQGQQFSAANNAAGLAQPRQQGYVNLNPLNPDATGGGTAGSAAALGGATEAQGQQGATVQGYKSALQQGQNLQSQVSDLITSFGLNPNDINAVNAGIQKIANNTSSPQYKILQNYVNDIANTYSQILTPPGGSATDTSRGIAQSMLDATASGQSIMDVMKALDAAAQAKIAGTPTYNQPSTQTSGSDPLGIL